MFSKSPVRQQVPDQICKKSIDTTIDSQKTLIFGGRSWTFFVQRRNFDFVPKMWSDTVWQEQMEQVNKKGIEAGHFHCVSYHDHSELFSLRAWWKK